MKIADLLARMHLADDRGASLMLDVEHVRSLLCYISVSDMEEQRRQQYTDVAAKIRLRMAAAAELEIRRAHLSARCGQEVSDALWEAAWARCVGSELTFAQALDVEVQALQATMRIMP
jgi:hypothetical protein